MTMFSSILRNRIIFIAVWVAFFCAFAFMVHTTKPPFYQLAAMALLIVAPGWMVRLAWKDYFKGRKCFRKNLIDESIGHYEKFLARIEKSPWTKGLIFFWYGPYTFKIEAQACNNIGLCYLYLKKTKHAAEYFQKALTLDSRFALPYFNLAILAILESDLSRARMHHEKAVKRGYKKIAFEDLVNLTNTNFQPLLASEDQEENTYQYEAI